MTEGQRDAQIALHVLPDDLPELTERFTLVLVRVEGGATLNPRLRESNFSIRYNDQPHGEFGLEPGRQAVEVNADMSRHVKVAVSRLAGTFGRVLAAFTISYNVGQTGIALDPSSGTVTFEEGENQTVTLVSIRGNAFLGLGSTFTVRLTEVQFLGSEVTSPPVVRATLSTVQVPVPPLAANTELSFSSSIAFVNEDDETLTVTLARSGVYGSLTVDWTSGYSPLDRPPGIEDGVITPVSDSMSMAHGQQEATLTVQLAAQVNRSEAFVLRLPRTPRTLVSGGARLANTNLLVQADPGGVLQFSTGSLSARASELDGKVTLTLWRLYGSESRLAIYYTTSPDTATSGLDFQAVSSGVVTMDARQTVVSFDLQIYQDNMPEQAESFYVNLTGVERLPTPIEPVLSPRLSKTKSLSSVTIAESNDPYGILSLTVLPTEVDEGVRSVSLTVVRSAGDFGAVSVRVRTVDGGESWTSQIVPDTSSSGPTPNTIAQALGRSRNKATGNMDYEILDTTVQLKAGQTEERLQIKILEDEIPELAESVLVYLTEPIGGARIATGTADGGKKGFVELLIRESDLSDGIIGFDQDSLSVLVDEDAALPVAALVLIRSNSLLGSLKVQWKAKKRLNSTDQEDAELTSQLNSTTGETICPDKESRCYLNVYLADDDIPEESSAFVVVLTGTDPEVRLNPDSRSAEVIIKPSDDVKGLITFAQESSVVVVNEGEAEVRLTVRREKGQGYDLEVSYETRQMDDRVIVSGSTVYPALDNQDFRGQSGTLTFTSGAQDPKYITVSLTPELPSDNPLPKQFFVRLSSPRNDFRVDPQGNQATIRLVGDADSAVWRIISKLEDDAFTNDDTIKDTVTQLDNQAENPLTDKSLDLIQDVLNKINAEGEKRSLPDTVVTNVRNLYCTLLESSLEDARKGRVSLATTVENFSYTLLKDKPCGAEGSNSKDVQKTECGAIKIASGRWRPNLLSGNKFNLDQGNSISIPNPLPDSDNNAGNECVDFSLVEYRKDTWFDTGKADAELLNGKIIGFSLKNRQSASIQNPVTFTIHTEDRRIAAKGAECKYFDEGAKSWVSPTGVCSVTNSHSDDDFVTCECKHMTNYGVSATTQGDNIIGYVVWFYIIC
ncbi:hypothetical protein EGW08_011871, partial [Elysia chlorotica]